MPASKGKNIVLPVIAGILVAAFWILVFAMFAFVRANGPAASPETGASIEGTLAANSRQSYTFTAADSGSEIVTMGSIDFQPDMMVLQSKWNGMTNSSRPPDYVHYGTGQESVCAFTGERGGRYTIIVSQVQPGGPGRYILNLSEGLTNLQFAR